MAVTLTLTRTTSFVDDKDGDGIAEAGDILRITFRISNVGDEDALNVTLTDTLDGLTLVDGSIKITPVAVNDIFNITGNTPITITAAQLLGNDFDPDGAEANITITGVSAGSNGTIVNHGDGTFTFTPATGFQGAANFTYTIVDEQGLASVDVGAVTVNVSGLVWYVDQAYDGANGPSDGSFAKPFTSLAPLNNDGTDPDGSGDTIFVYNRGTNAYNGGITLEANQKLFGDGHIFSVNGNSIGVSADATIINHSTANTGYGITLSTGNEIRGLTVNGQTTGTVGIQDGNGTVGSLTIANSNVTGTGKAIDIDQGGALNVTLGTLSSSGSTSQGVQLSGASGSGLTGTFSATGGSITGAAGTGFQIGDGTAGGATTLAVSYGGTIGSTSAPSSNANEVSIFGRGAGAGDVTFGGNVLHNAAGTAVSVSQVAGGAIAFNGALDVAASTGHGFQVSGLSGGSVSVAGSVVANTGSGHGIFVDSMSGGSVNFSGATSGGSSSGDGIRLSNNTGGAINFTVPNLQAVSVTGTAFSYNNAAPGSTLTVTGTNNSATVTGAGKVLDIANGAVGAAGVTFATLTANASTNGTAVSISNLDGNSFTVTGATGIAGTTGAAADGIFIGGGSTTNFSFGATTIGSNLVAVGDEGIEINGAGNGSVTFASVTINNTGGHGVEILGASNSVTINGGSIGNTNDPGGDGVNVTNGTGAVSIGAAITKTTAGNVVEVNNHETGNVTFSGNISATGNVNNGIFVTNSNSGTILFSGQTINIATGANAGVNLVSNTGGTINFAPAGGGNGLDIATTTGKGFTATGGGLVSVSGTGNTINSTTQTALEVLNTGIGGADLNFATISSGGGVNGIILSNTMSGTGGLTVTGTGANNSGGTIANSTGDGIVLTNTRDVNLTEMLLNNIVGHGINADNLAGSNSLINSTIQNWDTSATATKHGVRLVNLNTNMDAFTVTGSTFDGSTINSSTAGLGDGILMEAQGTSNMRLTVSNSTFTHMFSDGVQVSTTTNSSGTVIATIQNSTFTNAIPNSAPNVGGGNGGVSLTTVGNANFFADVNGNTFTDLMRPVSNAGVIGVTNGHTVDADITIRNNIISDVNGGRGITVTADGGTTDLLIDNNTIDDIESASKHAISVNYLGNTTFGTNATGNVTISNNDIGQAGPLWANGGSNGTGQAILVQTQDSAVMTALITGNTIDANAALEVIRGFAINTSTLNVTVTNNNVDDTAGSSFAEIGIQAGTGSTASVGGTVNASVTGNTIAASGVIRFDENANGPPFAAVNVHQASAAAVQSANPSATVGTSGSPTFGAAAPPLPTTPSLPPAPLMAAAGPDPVPEEEPLEEIVHDTPKVDNSGDTGGDTGDYTGDGEGDGDGGITTQPVGDPEPYEEQHAVIVDDGILTQAELDYLVEAAIQRWIDAGASDEQVAAMRAVAVGIADMTGLYVGSSDVGTISIDSDGAGYGWFLDTTPGEDSEFEGSGTRLTADSGGAADGRIDLLTVLMHELGHQIGLEDSYATADAGELMYGWFGPSERRLPAEGEAEGAEPGSVGHESYVLAPVNVGTVPDGYKVDVIVNATVDPVTNQLITDLSNTATVTYDNGGGPVATNSNTETTAIDTLTLGNLVFLDANANGVFDAGDSGIDGVTVKLFADANNDNVADSATPLATTTTAGGGIYSFTGLAPGNYIVQVSGAPLASYISSTPVTDPDNNVDNDDNGLATATAGVFASNSITLAYNSEPTAGTGNDTNNTLDFGFEVDDPGVANDDSSSVNEDATVAITVLGNDTDPDGPAPSVGQIAGQAVSAGDTVTLASGATATLNADGTITYNPNDKFNTLISASKATATGAVNSSAVDTFTYTLAAGGTATVTVTVDGVDSADDWLVGTGGNDTITGTTDIDIFMLHDGGSDTATGNDSNDGFYMGSALDALDNLDGQGGTLDQLGLQGNYPGYTFSASNLTNIEMIVLIPGSDTRFGDTAGNLYSYNLTFIDANVPAGQQLYISFNLLQAGENVTIDGSAETDGSFRTSGGLGADDLTGGAQDDGFYFGAQGRWGASDKVNGGPGGTMDQLGLHGLYAGATAISFAADQLIGIEMIVLLTGGDTRFGSGGLGYSYDLTMHQDNVLSGQQMVISANTLRADETLTFNGSAETDGSFAIYAGEAADTLVGSAGADILSGRGGADTMTGGAGDDHFLYSSAAHSTAAARDHILDFASGDKIDLSRIDAIAGGGDDAFTFVGNSAFSNTAGELRAVQSGGDWIVEADIDGDGAADLSILVTRSDAADMLVGDFIL